MINQNTRLIVERPSIGTGGEESDTSVALAKRIVSVVHAFIVH